MKNRWKALAGVAMAAALVVAPLVGSGAYATSDLCTEAGEGWLTKVDTTGDPATVTVTANEGFLIDAYCVKAGTTALIVDVVPPATTVTIDHPEKDSVSHYQVHQIPVPVVIPPQPPAVVTVVPVTVVNCETDIATTTTTTTTTPYVWNAESKTWVLGTPVVTEVVTTRAVTVAECPVTPPDDEVYPVPALFNAEPEPATCTSAGAFSTAFLGAEIPGEPGWYEFENVYVFVDRSVAGEVYLYIEAKVGFTLAGLNESKWDVAEDSLSAERTILIPAQLSGPEACPLVPVPAPAAPTFTDVCGTVNDGYTVPNNTDQFLYEVVKEGDTVTITAVLRSDDDEWAEGTVTEWSHTFTNVACPAGGTPPPPASGTPATPTGSLAVTGADDVNPIVPIGAGLAVLAGTALMVLRRRFGM